MLNIFQVVFVIISFSTQHLAEAQKEPHFKGNCTTIVHLFEWVWQDIAKECETFLGPEGYGGIQVSLMLEKYSNNLIIYKLILRFPRPMKCAKLRVSPGGPATSPSPICLSRDLALKPI